MTTRSRSTNPQLRALHALHQCHDQGICRPAKDKGITLLIGGKRTLKIGDTMGTVIVPFMKLDNRRGL